MCHQNLPELAQGVRIRRLHAVVQLGQLPMIGQGVLGQWLLRRSLQQRQQSLLLDQKVRIEFIRIRPDDAPAGRFNCRCIRSCTPLARLRQHQRSVVLTRQRLQLRAALHGAVQTRLKLIVICPGSRATYSMVRCSP